MADVFGRMGQAQQQGEGGMFPPITPLPVKPIPLDFSEPVKGQPYPGWSSGAVAAGSVALDFLKSLRQNKLAQAMDKENEATRSMEFYVQLANQKLQDPDLTPEAKRAVWEEMTRTLATHANRELKQAPKKGPLGFIKGVLSQLAGGDIPTREPINFTEAAGRLEQLTSPAGSPDSRQSYWIDLANQEFENGLAELNKQYNGNVPPEEVQALGARVVQKLNLIYRAPNLVNPWFSTVVARGAGASGETKITAMVTGRLLSEFAGQGQPAPAGQGASPAPAPVLPSKPIGTTEEGAPLAGVPGVTFEPGGQFFAMLAGGQEAQPGAAGQSAQAGAGQPATGDMSAFARAKERQIMESMLGLKPSQPTVLYNPSDTTQYVANVTFDRIRNKWIGPDGEPLPDYQQAWLPKDQLVTPTNRFQALDIGSDEKGNRLYQIFDRATGGFIGEPFKGGRSTPPKEPLTPEEIEIEVKKAVEDLYRTEETRYAQRIADAQARFSARVENIRNSLATGKFDPTVYTGQRDHRGNPITTAEQYANKLIYEAQQDVLREKELEHNLHENIKRLIGDRERNLRDLYLRAASRGQAPAGYQPATGFPGASTGGQAPAQYGPAPRSVSVDQEQIRQMVRQRAQAYGIDPDLAEAIARQESGFAPNAVSSAGAKGVMQLMPETARSLGVRNIWDPQENIDAGLRYLKALLDYYNGDVAKALAAYNAGPEAVNRAGGVPQIPETQQYVQSILSSLNKGQGRGSSRPPAPIVSGGGAPGGERLMGRGYQGVPAAVPSSQRVPIPTEAELERMFRR
jgi:hypothetical protein